MGALLSTNAFRLGSPGIWKDARLSTELLKEPLIELGENMPVSSAEAALRGGTNKDDTLETMLGSLGIAAASQIRPEADTDRWID